MSGGQAAYVKKIKVSTTGSSGWVDLPADSCSLEIGGDVIDDTEMATNAGYRSKILGLNNFSISIEAFWKLANAALVMVRAAKLGRSALYIQYLPDGIVANGFQGAVVVESYNQSGDLSAAEKVSITLQGNGALATAT